MPKSNAERQRDYRARKREGGTLGDRLAHLVVEVEGLQATVRGLERRLQVVEDRTHQSTCEIVASEMDGRDVDLRPPAERPGLGELQARIDAVVTRPETPAAPTFDPRTLTGPALRDYVRRYGPIPTDDPGDAA